MRQKLQERMKNLLNSDPSRIATAQGSGSTTGVTRQVRHNGVYQVDNGSSTREQTKKIVQSAAASVSI